MELRRGGDQRRPKRPQRVADRLLAALFTDNPALLPEEYADLVLCRTFGWTPAQLDEQDAERINLLLAMLHAESIVERGNSR